MNASLFTTALWGLLSLPVFFFGACSGDEGHGSSGSGGEAGSSRAGVAGSDTVPSEAGSAGTSTEAGSGTGGSEAGEAGASNGGQGGSATAGSDTGEAGSFIGGKGGSTAGAPTGSEAGGGTNLSEAGSAETSPSAEAGTSSVGGSGSGATTGEGGAESSDGGRPSRAGEGGVGGYGGSVDSSPCEEADAHASACNLLESGSLCRDVPTDTDVCLAGCMTEADCDVLAELRCAFDPRHPVSGPFEDPEGSFSEAGAIFAKCMNGCAFKCPGVRGEVTLPIRYRCDDIKDCLDDSDEKGCPDNSFECNDGRVIFGSWVCDEQYDCADAEDEAACDTGIDPVLSCD